MGTGVPLGQRGSSVGVDPNTGSQALGTTGEQDVGMVQTLLAGLREVLARCEAGTRPVVDASPVAAWAVPHASTAQGSVLAVPGTIVAAGGTGMVWGPSTGGVGVANTGPRRHRRQW